jgi:enamine deaminase RidA (YjgF/YER057c/UK114 family)
MPVEFYIGRVMSKHLPLGAIALIGPVTASARARKQVPLPAAQGTLPNVSGAAWAGNVLFASGWLDADLATHTDLESQTVGVFKSLQEFLEAQKLTLGSEA